MATSQEQPRLNELLSLKQAAKISGLTTGYLRRLARNDDLWCIKLGRNWFTTEQAVREYLARDRKPGPKSNDSPGSQ